MFTATDPPAAPSAREKILQTAHALFYREGIRATGIDRIIREAGVTKVTLYRHFPSKNQLIAAYLEERHARWMTWFTAALGRQPTEPGFPLAPVLAALREWFADDGYRGCAFINGIVELDGEVPAIADISRRHKLDMVRAIAALLPAPAAGIADAAGVAVDGAIIRAQIEASPATALAALETILRALCQGSADALPDPAIS